MNLEYEQMVEGLLDMFESLETRDYHATRGRGDARSFYALKGEERRAPSFMEMHEFYRVLDGLREEAPLAVRAWEIQDAEGGMEESQAFAAVAEAYDEWTSR